MLLSLGRAEALEATEVAHIGQDAMDDYLILHVQVYPILHVTSILTLPTNQTFHRASTPAVIEGTNVFDTVLACEYIVSAHDPNVMLPLFMSKLVSFVDHFSKKK